MKFVAGVVIAFFMGALVPCRAQVQDNRPEYQKEYEAYMNDLKVIAKTGKAPENRELEADLAKMDSEEKIRLTALKPETQTLETVSLSEISPLMFAQLDAAQAEIVNSVEIIRVPEEFRQQYADVYKEESKTISAQTLAERQSNMQKNLIVEDSTSKVASHLNPFRFLKEVRLSPLPGEYGTKELPLNPMVNAYFNQFGRPYLPDAPVAAEVQPQQKQDDSLIKTLSLRNSMFVN